MNGKQRLAGALSHTEGPVPLDLGATAITGIHCSIVEKLREYYGLEKKPVRVSEMFQMLGAVEDDLVEALGADIIGYPSPYNMFSVREENYKEWKTPWGQEVLVPGDFHVSERDGAVFTYPGGDRSVGPSARIPEGGFFFDAIERQGPLDEDSLNPRDNCEEYAALDEFSLEFFRANRERYTGSRYGVVGGPGGTGLGDIAFIPGIGLKRPKGVRTVEEWYVSTVTRPELLHEIFALQTEMSLTNLQTYHSIVGDCVDVTVVCGTDFGTQIATFCSRETLLRLYVPYYRMMNDWIHSHTNWKTFKHTCGAIEPFIDTFVNCGFDIINPVQWTAAGMDRETLKKKHGADIVFWGAGVDTQKTLPFGTPKDVRSEVLECLKIFAKGGGFVCNAIHNVQAKTPIENVVALVDAVKEFNGER